MIVIPNDLIEDGITAWNRRAPAPASQTVAVHTDPEGYQDGAWHWVKTSGFGGDSITAPAMYKANVGAWYSYEFAGISTRFLDVLGPCKPATDIYAATQVQDMLSAGLAPGWQAVPVEPTMKMIAALGFDGDEDLAIGHASISVGIEKAYRAMLAASPSGPAREPHDHIEDVRAMVQAVRQATDALDALQKRLFDERIGKACSHCEGGTYQADHNGYSQFHRCNKCRHVPMWGEDGLEFGITAAQKGGQHGTE